MHWLRAFHRPSSVAEAIRLMAESRGAARFVAGATDILVQSNRKVSVLIDIGGVGLSYIKPQAGGWAIGAGTTFTAIERSPELCAFADGILARAAASAGSEQVRNAATTGGNLANGSPAADLAPPLLALDASVVIARRRRKSVHPLAKFFLGPHQTVLGDELLVEIRIPAPPAGRAAWAFEKMQPIGGSLAIINVAAGVGLDKRGRCRWARIAVGSAAPLPMRVPRAEALLEGQALEEAAIAAAAELVSQEISPQTDNRATAEYRREMSQVLVKRVLCECAAHMKHAG